MKYYLSLILLVFALGRESKAQSSLPWVCEATCQHALFHGGPAYEDVISDGLDIVFAFRLLQARCSGQLWVPGNVYERATARKVCYSVKDKLEQIN